ncbi:MAG: 2-dehydropantoate 2-reductase [Clostridia bacterium]|nr:2-dehydropantoate 2-reductase [Clostridia bacterium]
MRDIRELKIAVYGAGAMGTVLGALLVKGGLENVQLITRNQAHADGLNKNGATVVCVADDTEFNVPVTALTPAQMQGKYDVVFLMTKQRQNKDILQFLLPFLSDDSVVCTTQNGLPERLVAEIVGENRTYGGVASFGATMYGGGRVALTSKTAAASMQIAGYATNAKTPLLLEVLSYAAKATGNENFAKKAENLSGARWSKLAINAAFSGLSVVTGLSFGEIAKGRKSRKIALGILRECMDVAAAQGVVLEKMQGHDMQKMLGKRGFFATRLALFVLPIAMKKHKKLYSGMLKDLQNGKKCEIDFINGVVVENGRDAGVLTPFNERVVRLVHDAENGLCEVTPENLDFFE